ncbi:MAG: hypothetical protein ACPGO5_00555 [Patescibacteria group bacterium]
MNATSRVHVGLYCTIYMDATDGLTTLGGIIQLLDTMTYDNTKIFLERSITVGKSFGIIIHIITPLENIHHEGGSLIHDIASRVFEVSDSVTEISGIFLGSEIFIIKQEEPK